MPNDKSAPPPTRQEQREHAEPGESQTPIPLGIKLLVAVLIVWGIYYIANAPINVPSSLGDGRTVADLEKGKAGGGSGAADNAALFASRCAACHQAAGQGLPGCSLHWRARNGCRGARRPWPPSSCTASPAR